MFGWRVFSLLDSKVFSLFFSAAALKPPKFKRAAAACADVVEVPVVDVVAAAELREFTMRSKSDDFPPLCAPSRS